jgi:hypothetical protein
VRSTLTRGLWTALPFIAIFAAQETRIHTRIEDDATALREAALVGGADRQEALDKGLDELVPGGVRVRERSGSTADGYRIARDIRVTDPEALGDVLIERTPRFALWPVFSTVYTYTDNLTRTGFTNTEREQGAAAKTEFEYSVTLPGVVDESSLQPVGGLVDGGTVTWKLKADQERQTVSATSVEAEWAPLAFVVGVLLIGLLLLARFVADRQRNTPKRI